MPHWVENAPVTRQLLPTPGADEGGGEEWRTQFWMPVSQRFLENDAWNKLSRRIGEVQPSMLLFLHRIRSIMVHDQLRQEVREMRRVDGADGLVTISMH